MHLKSLFPSSCTRSTSLSTVLLPRPWYLCEEILERGPGVTRVSPDSSERILTCRSVNRHSGEPVLVFGCTSLVSWPVRADLVLRSLQSLGRPRDRSHVCCTCLTTTIREVAHTLDTTAADAVGIPQRAQHLLNMVLTSLWTSTQRMRAQLPRQVA